MEPANGTHFVLKEMQDAVGGCVEVVYLMDGRLMLVNEDGHNIGLPYNAEGTRLYRAGRDIEHYIVGDVLVCERKQVR